MNVLRCQIEDLPGHIAAIERYTHLFNVDLIKSGIKDNLIKGTKESYYHNDNIVPTKLVDNDGNIIQYLRFYHGKTIPVTLLRGGFLSEYGSQHYKAIDLFNVDIVKSYLDYAITEKTTEVLTYQRMARSRFTNEIIKQFTEPGMPLEGWKVRVVAKIPPYGVVKDKLLSQWLVGEFNGIVPDRMTITQISKII